VIFLTLPELLYIAERTLGPDYAVRDYGLLEAALARPQATAFGKDAYPDLDAKAAALLHSIARNHALIDGIRLRRAAGGLAEWVRWAMGAATRPGIRTARWRMGRCGARA